MLFVSPAHIHLLSFSFFFFNDTATTEIYTLSLHDALPICVNSTPLPTVNTTGYIDHAAFLGTINPDTNKRVNRAKKSGDRKSGSAGMPRPISYAVFCLKKKKNDYPISTTCHYEALALPTLD